MDAAQEFVLEVSKRQNAMNAVIDRFDSPVQQFYRGATVLVTGGSGFLGKQLIEKLFRSCEIKKLYMLLRPRKGRTSTIDERLQTVLKDPVFEPLREKQPNFADRIVTVEGDVTDIRLGLSDEHWTKLTHEVDTIFHGAATVRFDAPLRSATLINVRGTREVIALARACPNLKSFVHISTAYTHATKDRVGKEVLEQFYETPISPDLMIAMAEELDEKKLDEMTESFLNHRWPNTYTFTKAVAEELLRTATDLPLSLVRPPIVTHSYTEPSPGWLDMNAVQGASGVLLGIILGIIRVFYVSPKSNLPLTPVDYVNNCVIAAGWDAAEQRKRGEKDIPVYTVSNKDKYIIWGRLGNILRKSAYRYATPKAVWYCETYEVTNKLLYTVLSWFLHYIPAYIADAVCFIIRKKPKGMQSFVSVYNKIDKFADIFHYFLSNTWIFKDDNVKAMCKRMNVADRAIYNCDVSDIDIDEYCLLWYVGARKYIVKDGLEGSAAASERHRKLKIVNYIFMALLFYSVWKIACFFLYLFIGAFGLIGMSF